MYQINERLTWLRGRHTLKFGGSWNYYQSAVGLPGQQRPERLHRLQRVQLHGRALRRLPARPGVAEGPRLAAPTRGRISSTASACLPPTTSRSTDQPDAEPRPAVGLHVAVRREGRPAGQLRSDQRGRSCSPDRTATAARCTSRSTTGGSRGSGSRIAMGERWVFRGGYGITQYMEGTGANLRLPLNPPFFFESEVRYDRTSGPGTIATGFEGLQALDRASGQLRAWDPELRPQFTQQWNVFAEYLLGSRSSINVGYVGNKSTQLVTPIDGNQPLPGTGDPSTWLPVQQRRPLYPLQPAHHVDQHDGVARAQRLQRAADDVQAAALAGAGLRRQLHPGQGDGEQLRVLRQRRRRRRGRVSDEQLRHRGQLRPGGLRRAARLLDGRQLRAAVRQGAAVRQQLEPRARRDRRRLVGELRGHGPHRASRSR